MVKKWQHFMNIVKLVMKHNYSFSISCTTPIYVNLVCYKSIHQASWNDLSGIINKYELAISNGRNFGKNNYLYNVFAWFANIVFYFSTHLYTFVYKTKHVQILICTPRWKIIFNKLKIILFYIYFFHSFITHNTSSLIYHGTSIWP